METTGAKHFVFVLDVKELLTNSSFVYLHYNNRRRRQGGSCIPCLLEQCHAKQGYLLGIINFLAIKNQPFAGYSDGSYFFL